MSELKPEYLPKGCLNWNQNISPRDVWIETRISPQGMSKLKPEYLPKGCLNWNQNISPRDVWIKTRISPQGMSGKNISPRKSGENIFPRDVSGEYLPERCIRRISSQGMSGENIFPRHVCGEYLPKHGYWVQPTVPTYTPTHSCIHSSHPRLVSTTNVPHPQTIKRCSVN